MGRVDRAVPGPATTTIGACAARPSQVPSAAEMRAASVVAGRFEIERLAGAGGMGSVYRARDRETSRPVGVKVLKRSTDENARRFERECRILARLAHPAIVEYLAHGETEHATGHLRGHAGEAFGRELEAPSQHADLTKSPRTKGFAVNDGLGFVLLLGLRGVAVTGGEREREREREERARLHRGPPIERRSAARARARSATA